MRNAAAVLAVLRATFPVASGVHVLGWDAGLTAARDVNLLSQTYQVADVVVTGAGLHTLQHLLLRPSAHVVEVETAGVSWEDIEMRGSIGKAFASRRFLAYEALLSHAGVLPQYGPRLGDLDYPALRANSDYRVNVRAVVRAVGLALARGGWRGCVRPQMQPHVQPRDGSNSRQQWAKSSSAWIATAVGAAQSRDLKFEERGSVRQLKGTGNEGGITPTRTAYPAPAEGY